MSTSTAPAGSPPASTNVLSRFIGIITAPRVTFERVVANPKWLGMFLLTATIIALGTALPMTTEAGQQAAVDQQVTMLEGFGMQIPDEQYDRMLRSARFLPYQTAIGGFISLFLFVLLVAAILWAVFNAALGGDATYKQVLTVTVHAGAISALGQMFTGPLNYFRGSVASATNLSVLLPMVDETSFAGRLAGAIDFFLIWWLLVLAIGLGVLYRRRTQPIAISLFAVYAVIAVGIAAVMS